MDASNLPKLQSDEFNMDGRPINLPGVYVHKDTGQKFITSSDFRAGVAQADALMSPNMKEQTGAWERVGDPPTISEVKEMQKAQEIKDATDDALRAGEEAEELKAAKKKALEEAKAKAEAEKEAVATK